MRNELETVTIAREVESCEDTAELGEILKKYEEYYVSWKSCVNRLLDESGLSYVRFAEKCGVSKNTVKKWSREGGAPRSRNTFIKIGFGLTMDPGQVSRLLVRYGGYHGLSPKDPFDAVCIYALQRRAAGDDTYTFARAESLYSRCAFYADETAGSPKAGKDGFGDTIEAGGKSVYLETVMAEELLLNMQTEEDVLRFTAENPELFQRRGKKLASYVEDYLRAKWQGKNVSAALNTIGLPKRFEKILSGLFVHGSIPRREKLIALAIHLEMSPEETDRLLILAGMEGLCAKDRLECVVIYALQQICLLHPELPLSNAMELLAVSRDEELRRRCRDIVEEYTVNCYRCSEEEADSAADYVRDLLCSLDLEEAGELLELI